MKLCQLFFAAAFVAAIGCETKSPPGGNVSTTDKTTMGTPDMAFRLTVPSQEIDLDRGETEKFQVEVKKGKNFTQDVEVSFADLPAGVTVTPATFTTRGNENADQNVTMTATKDAPKGKFTITVVGKPTTGEMTKTTMKVEVSD